MSGVASRLAAAEVLNRVLTERRTLDESLSLTPSFTKLTGSDRGFARAMVSAALRQLGRIKHGLEPFLKRDFETADMPVQSLLLIGAAQLWLMNTPTHAGVGETVSAAKAWPEARKASGFVNAILRKASTNRAAFDAAPRLAVWPNWLASAMAQSLDPAPADALARAQTVEPVLHLSVKPGQMGTVEAAFSGTEISTERLSENTLSVPSGAVETFPLYEDGVWWVQDLAAALPAQLLTGGTGRTLADLCAAPGGKTMQLAATGADVFAIDRSAKRLGRVTENLTRTGLTDNTQIIAADAQTWEPPASTLIDGVLVDAPCSALGTLRRHPEGAWIKRSSDIESYPKVQKRLLQSALKLVRPGGEVIYCVCSPFPSEGAAIVESILQDANCARLPIEKNEVPGFEPCLTPSGDLLTLPVADRPAYDAFFIARLTKTA